MTLPIPDLRPAAVSRVSRRLIPVLLIGVWTAASLWLGTDAGLSITALILTAYGGMLLLAIWLVRLVRWLVRGRRTSGIEPVAIGRRVLRWVWELVPDRRV